MPPTAQVIYLFLDFGVHLEQVLSAVRVGGREEVREEPLDEREHQHVTDCSFVTRDMFGRAWGGGGGKDKVRDKGQGGLQGERGRNSKPIATSRQAVRNALVRCTSSCARFAQHFREKQYCR